MFYRAEEERATLNTFFSHTTTHSLFAHKKMPAGLAAVPPAQLPSRYQDVIKIALRPRQSRAFLLAFAAWHVLLALTQLRTLAVFSPLTLLLSSVSFALGILPFLVRRKRVLSTTNTCPPRLPPSQAAQLSAVLSSSSTWSLAYGHAIGFVVLGVAYALLVTATSGGWGPQIWVESHGSYYLNERFLFLLGHAAVLGAVYSVAFRTLPSLALASSAPFDASISPSEPLGSLKEQVTKAFRARVAPAAAAGFAMGTLSVVLYSTIRIRIWKALLLIMGTRSMTRRVLVPSFRVDFGYVQVALRSTLFSMAAICAVETAYLLLDVYLCHSLPPVTKYSKNPNRLLLDGISDPTLFFSSHAFGELARLSATDSEARIAIYRDVGIDGAAWPKIRDLCLKIIEEQTTFIDKRGQLVVSAKPTTTVAGPQLAKQQQQQQAPSQTVWDMLAAGSVPQPRNAQPASTTPTTPAGKPAPAPTMPTLLLNTSVKLVRTAWALLPADAKHVLFGPRRQQAWIGESVVSQAQSVAGRDAARVTWAILSLKELLCHSLDQDPYGSVQKDIRLVLTSLAQLGTHLRKFGLQLEQKAVETDNQLAQLDPSKEALPNKPILNQQQLTRAWRTSGAETVDLSLTHSIKAILDTFGRFGLHLGPDLELQLSQYLS